VQHSVSVVLVQEVRIVRGDACSPGQNEAGIRFGRTDVQKSTGIILPVASHANTFYLYAAQFFYRRCFINPQCSAYA
jgi:hypothetical protein